MRHKTLVTAALSLSLLLSSPPGVADAAPPSSVLRGDNGVLSWTVTRVEGGWRIDGRSPKWTVRHDADEHLRPTRTVRSDAEGVEVTVDYTPAGATVHRLGKTVVRQAADLWDADTTDVRLGAIVATGTREIDFTALDPASGKVYDFRARRVGMETCGLAPCTHMVVSMTGLLAAVGPKWEYWYGADGRLLRFDGPIGAFSEKD